MLTERDWNPDYSKVLEGEFMIQIFHLAYPLFSPGSSPTTTLGMVATSFDGQPRGLLPYMDYIDMCRGIWYGF